MSLAHEEQKSFFFGVLMSVVGHVLVVGIALARLEAVDAHAIRAPEVVTVTLEGGEVLGGINQVPTKQPKVVPAVQQQASEPDPVQEATKLEQAKLEQAALLEAEREREEQRERKQEEEKKKQAEEAKKQQELAKKREAQRKLAEQKRREEAEKRKQERRRKLREAAKRASQKYEGESYDAGGTGFGAARTGGKGMGGGTQRSIEWVSYSNQLQNHIKKGWRWIGGKERLKAQVLVYILPSGTIREAKIIAGSGNQNFDDSVLRAVYKANPVPPAPAHIYDDFRQVRITFDTQDR